MGIEHDSALPLQQARPAARALYPADPAARSQVERWMDWQLASLNAPYLGVFREAKKKEEERARALPPTSRS